MMKIKTKRSLPRRLSYILAGTLALMGAGVLWLAWAPVWLLPVMEMRWMTALFYGACSLLWLPYFLWNWRRRVAFYPRSGWAFPVLTLALILLWWQLGATASRSAYFYDLLTASSGGCTISKISGLDYHFCDGATAYTTTATSAPFFPRDVTLVIQDAENPWRYVLESGPHLPIGRVIAASNFAAYYPFGTRLLR